VAIERQTDGDGAERFDAFMDRCLYGPDGFYTNGGAAGRRGGDFITSPEVGPLFGAVLFRAIDAWWADAGRPDPFTVYDVGCGPGTLLRAIGLAAGEAGRRWNLIGVDRAGGGESVITELPPDLSSAVVVGNELLDNMAFRVIEQTPEGLAEVYVTASGDSELRPVDIDRGHPVSAIGVGERAPLMEQAAEWVADTLTRQPIKLCLFDYGAVTTAELAGRGGWLRTYRRHQRGDDPLVDPGSSDITADVGWDQLPTPSLLVHQRDFLASWGIAALVDEGREYWNEHAAAPDLTAFRMRSRISEAEALTDDQGLGRFWSASW
jgi:SAM-dependent MidA family methyltransferase